MSRLVARILLSMLMFPLAVLVYVLAFAIAESAVRSAGIDYSDREKVAFLTAGVVTWAGVAGYWWLLWKGSVRWTSQRVGMTFGAGIAAALVGVIIAAVVGSAFIHGSGVGGFVICFGGILAILLWLFATIFLWRETTAERAARLGGAGASTVSCPSCGYNLTGLSEARCPECGSRFTLNELMAGQPGRAGVGLMYVRAGPPAMSQSNRVGPVDGRNGSGPPARRSVFRADTARLCGIIS